MAESNRVQLQRRMILGRGDLEVFRQAVRENGYARTSMLMAAEGVAISQASTDLRVTGNPGDAFVTVAAGEAYFDDDYINLSAAAQVNLPGVPGPLTYGLRIRHAVSRFEPGSIAVVAGLATVNGTGTRFTRYNPEDRIEFASGGNSGVLWVIATVTSDVLMTVTALFFATQPTVTDWRYRAHFAIAAPGEVYDTTTAAGAYDGYAFVLDGNPPAANEILLANVTTDGAGNFASVQDMRSATALTMRQGIREGITDTYGIYPNDTLQDHVNAVGAVSPATFASVNNAHAISAYDIYQPSATQQAGMGTSAAVRVSAMLDEMIHVGPDKVFIPHYEIIGTDIAVTLGGIESSWGAVGTSVDGAFGLQRPRQNIIASQNDWTFTLLYNYAMVGGGPAELILSLYWLIPGQPFFYSLAYRGTFVISSNHYSYTIAAVTVRGSLSSGYATSHGFLHGIMTKTYSATIGLTAVDVVGLMVEHTAYSS